MTWQEGLCIVCGRGKTLPHQEWCRRVADANRKANLEATPGLREHCPYGHPYDETNTYLPPTGGRQCRACRKVGGGGRTP